MEEKVMHLPNFGSRTLQITIIYKQQERRGTLSEIHGTHYHWWLHFNGILAGTVIYDGNLRFKTFGGHMQEIEEQLFEVIMGWYG